MKNETIKIPRLLWLGTTFGILGTMILSASILAAERQPLHGHVPAAVANLKLEPAGRLPATNCLHLAIGLPLRNREPLTNLLQRIYDPANPDFRKYLTPE